MGIRERISMAIGDYYQKHGCKPSRITVSREVARELDAALMVSQNVFGEPNRHSPVPVQDGENVRFQGVPVVVDMNPDKVLDIR